MTVPTHYDNGERIGSWVIVTHNATVETFSHRNATLFYDTGKCKVIPIRTYLENLNREVKQP